MLTNWDTTGFEWTLNTPPKNETLQQMAANYRRLAAEHVWRQDFPDLCWCMAKRYGSRLSFFVNEARVIRDQLRSL